MTGLRLPGNDEHTTLIGRTGTGKTQAGAFQLSRRSYSRQPWSIIDFKGDKLLNKIPGVQAHPIEKRPPRHPGVYIIHCIPKVDAELLNHYLWQVWHDENHGVFIDEAFQMNYKDEAYTALLTSGRSKECPIISCTQRPAWVTKMLWSETSHFQCFSLNDDDDVKSVQRFVKRYPDEPNEVFPRFHSLWHDIGAGQTDYLLPVPNEASILSTFANRMPPKRTSWGWFR